MQDEADARDTERDQRGVRDRADRRDEHDVLAPQSLPEHEEVLGADRDDERETEPEAGEKRGEHILTIRSLAASVQLMILHRH